MWMQAPPGAPEWLEAVTAAERPDLWERSFEDKLLRDIWPEYNLHGSDAWQYLPAIFPAHGVFQVLFLDGRTARVMGRGRAIGMRWNGTLRDLPRGIDDAGLRALAEARPPTVAVALAAEIDNEYQRQGLSELLLRAMGAAARSAGLTRLLVPARPSWKERYPLIPIDRYAAWRRDDGLPVDPWLRVHIRMGARLLRPEPRSMRIDGPVGAWEEWTGMSFPGDGQYVIPGGLAPVRVSRGRGYYWEPNVWMEHDLSAVEVADRVAAPDGLARSAGGGALGALVRHQRRRLGRVARRLGLRA